MRNNIEDTLRRKLIRAFRRAGKFIPALKREAGVMMARDTFSELQNPEKRKSSLRTWMGFILVEKGLEEAGYNLEEDTPYKDVLGLEDGREGYVAFKSRRSQAIEKPQPQANIKD